MRAFIVLFVAACVTWVAAAAFAGGIADEPCPTVAGEHTNVCPAATVGVPYELRFRENEGSGCGPGRQSFHLDSGTLPPGLELAADGTLHGRPLSPGRFRFYVQMREPQNEPGTCAGKRTEKEFTLWVRTPLTVDGPPAPPRAEVGVPLRVRLRARGGSTVYAWKTLGRRLPRGLRLGTDGSLVGTPRDAGRFGVLIRVRDTDARVAEWTVTLHVAPRLRASAARLPDARVGGRYGARLKAKGGVEPTAWRIVSGRLPRGLRLLATGRILGTPREAGVFRAVVRARDALAVAATRSVRIVVSRR